MLPDSLRADLKDPLYWWLEELPRGRRCWVMSYDWLCEVRHLDYGSGAFWVPEPRISEPLALFGLPIQIREGGNPWRDSVPHLEAP